MRILHTSDWHLGKNLEHVNRLEEQEQFIEELEGIADEENIDLIIIAGDIYDVSTPPVSAEKLFYKSLKNLTKDGKRVVFVVAGNHDSPERLTAVDSLIEDLGTGIIIMGTPKSVIPKSDFKHYSVVDSGEGFVEINIKGENIVILGMPYPSDKRLNEIISEESSDELIQKEYSEKIGQIFRNLSEKYRDDTINIAVGHFHVRGGEVSTSERDIQIGGSMAVNVSDLPQNAQYIAMGHLHRPQRISGEVKNVYYSGSPIQYSKSEINYSKSVYIIDIEAKKDAVVTKKYLRNYKPIEIWKTKSIEEALLKCKESDNENIWIFLEIETDRVLTNSEIKELKTNKKNIIEILPIFKNIERESEIAYEEDRTIQEEFIDFYEYRRGAKISKETLEVFSKICNDIEL